MKEKIKAIAIGVKAAVRHHPVEVILAAVFCVIGCVSHDCYSAKIDVLLAYFPVLFLATYMLNALTDSGRWRLVYYFSLFLFVPFLWNNKELDSIFWGVTLSVIQLLYLVSDWKIDNTDFIRKGLCYLRALLSAGLFAGVAWLLSMSIFFSVQYIFEIWQTYENRVLTYLTSIAFAGIMPLLFLVFNKKEEGEGSSEKLVELLLNYVLSPALLVYTVILYLYFLKMTVLWSLPKGAVAYMVMSFITGTFLLKGCQPFLGKQYYNWFYRYASLAVLPALAMFWIGTFYRINRYGFTEARVYLVVVGAILTGVVLLFLSKRIGRYLYAALLAVILLASVTYVPGITAKDIERISQTKRGDYPIRKDRFSQYSYFSIMDPSPLAVDGYETIQPVRSYQTSKGMWATTVRDTFFLYNKKEEVIFKEEVNSLLERQLKESGLLLTDLIPEEAYPIILRIDLDSALFVLDEISVSRYSPDSIYSVSNIAPGYYLKKRVSLPLLKEKYYEER